MKLSMFYKFPLKLFAEVEPIYGEGQKKISVAYAGHDVREFIKPGSNSVLHIMSYNFPKSEWDDQKWLGWLKEQHSRGVKIKVVGGPEIEAKGTLEQLLKDEIIDVKILNKPIETHFIFVDNPKQLWVESYHRDAYAKDCFFTDKPYEETWQSIQNIFNGLWNLGKCFSYS